MKKYIEEYKEFISPILLLLYGCGYIYYKIYYSHFGIEIEYYISLSDFIFYTINFILYLVFLVIGAEVILYLLTQFILSIIYSIKYKEKKKDYPKIEEFIENEIDKRIVENYGFSSFSLLILLMFLSIFLTDETLISMSVFFILIMIKLFFMIKRAEKGEKEEVISLKNIFGISLLVIFLFLNLSWGFKDAYSIKGSKESIYIKRVEFVHNEKIYSTIKQKNLVYIGETSTYFFLYDRSARKSLIFFKENVSNFTIDDPLVSIEENIPFFKKIKSAMNNK